MMTKEKQLDPPFIDEEEKHLIEAFKRGEFVLDSDFAGRKAELEQSAKQTMKRRAINIRLAEMDIRRIKMLAHRDGIPYQTLISSIVHRYAEGTLKRND